MNFWDKEMLTVGTSESKRRSFLTQEVGGKIIFS